MLNNQEILCKDIEGNDLRQGDEVYYARKESYRSSGELVCCTAIRKTPKGWVNLSGGFTSKSPRNQLIKKK